MLDPLTALSLAGNIIQFVDFASKLFVRGREIYNSAEGLSVCDQELETIAKDLRDISTRFKPQIPPRLNSDFDELESGQKTETKLTELSNQCCSIAEELLDALGKLKLSGLDRNNRRWKSVRHAFKSLWNTEEMGVMVARLQSLREEWSLHILVSLRNNLDIHALKQLEGFEKLEQGAKDLADLIKFEHEWTRKTIRESIEGPRSERHQRNAGALGNVSASEGKPEDGEKLRFFEDMLLESLQFATMTDRFDEVHPAHEKTYEWIFKAPDTSPQWLKWTDFPKWLAEGKGTYWINGKAASGKSTIMRYICDNPQTTTLLKEWAHPKLIIIATHFFWSSGTPDQRSYTGLLRALIFKILQQRRDLIPEVFPREWNKRRNYPLEAIKNLMSISWTLSKLRRVFKRIFEKSGDDTRFCLFIDGLDEYDGDPNDIIDLFMQMPSKAKVCLSSRPLHDFATAFKSSSGLRLQDLTFGDIKQYVDDELGANAQMKELQFQHPEEGSKLVLEIVNKADGVFLWVKLVVLSLIRGLRNSDQISDLQRRLWLLPPSLEDLFTQIIGKLEPVYIQQSSRIFQIFAKFQESNKGLSNFSSLELFFAENQDWNMLILPPIRSLKDKDLISRCEIVDTWLRTRCGGLIEAHRDPRSYQRHNKRLAYLHRTVHDFLNLPEIKSRILRPTTGTGFSAYQALVQSSVLYLKW
ncbi:hypothetical protein N431DRAFT_304052, partial [Stipitochalara longipes BDJ]